ncbi:phage tail assembly chaperone [Methylovorus menthalis]|uniref:phage tail assembly chaperone n=1 Tax=Methylovorus menthalis TaxID=1002227 RepID=UPI001E5067FE|nr:phage tail assembly chaperone [Methylovorus menthalis]MCB4811703.1 phage tail assembly chaperone [Methylovorus menthalis]
MKIFHVFDESTREYLHDYEAQESPEEPGIYIRPTCSSDKPLPDPEPGKYRAFSLELDAFELVEDPRGFWYTPEGELVKVDSVLEDVPGAWSRTQPAPTVEQQAVAIRIERDARISAVSWRYERHAREERLGIPLTDDIAELDEYIQDLAEVPEQSGFPQNVEWPDSI